MTGMSDDDGSDALLDRLRVIEDQPLESRAEALGHLHDELRTRLEAEDARGGEPRPNGDAAPRG
jgi:hypothetical protein